MIALIPNLDDVSCPPVELGRNWNPGSQNVSPGATGVKTGFPDSGGGGKGLMSHEDSDEPDSCAEPDSTFSDYDCEEIVLLNHLFALIDPRPDPGIYRNADSDGAARDLVELSILISFEDPRPYTNPWAYYILAEELLDQP